MMTRAAPQTCVACGASPTRSFRLSNGADLLRCPRCRLAWWPWPAFDAAAFYDEDYFQSTSVAKGYSDYAALERGVRRTARSRLRRIGRLLGTARPVRASGARRMFEIGCGTGVFLDEARAAGWDVRGVEVSAYAAGRARARGLDVACGTLAEHPPPPSSFDCVALWDVIEHVAEPAALLQTAAAALRPGGVLALSTGDITSACARWSGARWHLFNLPEHLFFFSPQSLRRLIEDAGARVGCVRHETNWVPLSYVFERLRKGGGLAGALVGRLPAALARRLGERVIPATLFDVLGVYAVRPR